MHPLSFDIQAQELEIEAAQVQMWLYNLSHPLPNLAYVLHYQNILKLV